MPDIGGIPTYPSTLTGPELDEALRNIGLVEDSVKKASEYAQTSEQYGTIVEQNQTAIQAIEDNLDLIQQAPQNAQTAQNAAQTATEQATAASGSASSAAQSAAEAKQWAESASTVVVPYTITVPTTSWTTGSLTWGGTTYTRQCTVVAADATANPTSVSMSYAGGDYDAYCQVGLIDTRAGSVVLWATQDPTAECQIRVLEVRSNGQS